MFDTPPPSPPKGPTTGPIHYQTPAAEFDQSDLSSLKPFMLMQMLRNVTTDGFVVQDPVNPQNWSLPGCVIAAPSFPANTPGVDQDYVFNWVRDAAITAIEIAKAGLPTIDGGIANLIDYVTFADLCQTNAAPTKGHACFTIYGQPRPWTEQSDGPALQTVAILAAYPLLDKPTQTKAVALIGRNLDYLLGAYQEPTTNLWEEHSGLSFFARSAQLRCFQEIAANKIGIKPPSGLKAAIAWLQTALASHWNGSLYVSLMVPGGGPPTSVAEGYDANIDIVSASLYGAIPCTDTKLLATAAVLRSQWDDTSSAFFYPINAADKALGVGPLFGRYPDDVYDGDVADPVPGRHPWALCTANFAELNYTLAKAIQTSGKVPLDELSTPFFAQVGVTAQTSAADAVTALRGAADAMLRAVLYHSDHYELSEQYDGVSGFERSVRNLTWSYAAFLSALRARDA